MTVRISTAYGITKPGEVPYSSENFRIAIDIEEEMSQEAAETLLAQVTQQVKLAVINEAGLMATTDENGVVVPVFAARQAAAPAPAVTEQAATVTPIADAPSAQPGAGRSAGGPKDLTWDGRPVTVYDNRGKKAAGEHKPNAADFRVKFLDVGEEAPDNVKFKGVWLKNQNGSVNQAGVALQQAYDAS